MNSPAVLPSHQQNDLEAGTYKDAPIQRINRWRQARILLCASRPFLHILCLLKREGEQASSEVHAHAAAEHALATEAGEEVIGNIQQRRTSTTGDFVIGREELVALTRNDDVGGLEQYGGIEGLECLLKTNLQDGINGEDADVAKRISVFGANTYPAEKSKSFLTCLWEACHQDISQIIFIVVAVASSVMGLVTKVRRFGYWEEGGNVAAVVMVNIIVKAICEYLVHNVKEEGRNMKVVRSGKQVELIMQVVRGGKQVEVSICDIVVGDVIPLNIGDQVPAYGILITAQSLSIDTSRVNGDNSDNLSLDASSGAYRLKPGWKIADGSGTMLVTSVGICTKSELSQEIGNKTTFKEVLNATCIGNVGLAVAFIAMMVLLLRWFMYLVLIFGVETKPRDVIEDVNQIIIIAFNIAVAAVPQGLPLAVTLTIFSATKRMVADNAFVRRPLACVTMAVVKNFLCDKTVLTLNEDRCQPGVKEKVQRLCQRDGVKVRMVTRDNLPTAKAIALECGIFDSDADASMPNHLFDGREFGKLTDDRQRQECAQRIKVMACCSPDVKLLFLQALKQSGEMVAVTGYVTVDAHALRQADIGFAMGIRGNEVVKESSDIIILDDNFATCVKAFKWGRSVHPNIIKFMQLQLTVNVVALTTNFMAAVFYGHVPLNAVQLLWVNLLIVPLSLITKPPAEELMSGLLVEHGQPPKRYVKWKRLVFQGVYQIVAILIINFQGWSVLKSYTSGYAIKVKNTMIFNTFVVCQIIHQMEARKKGILSKPKKWITSNYLFIGIAGTILISQFIIIEFLGKAFSTVALNRKEWQFSLTLGFTEMLFAIILFVKYLKDRN